jgi:hypothetical protein
MVMVVEPNADPFAVYDPETCEGIFADWYKQSISAVIPSGMELTPVFWLLLADIATKFKIIEKCRAARRSPASEIKRWRRIAKLVKEGVQDATSERITYLVERKLTSHLAFRGDFSRKYNRNNELLYIWVLEDLWCRGLGQELAISLNKKAPPGPLIRFFLACVNPLLEKPLTANAADTIVRKRREEQKIAEERSIRAQNA